MPNISAVIDQTALQYALENYQFNGKSLDFGNATPFQFGGSGTQTQPGFNAGFNLNNAPYTGPTVKDGAAISNNGPFTIADKFGNTAITHPN